MSAFLDATNAAMGQALSFMKADSVTYQGVTVDCVATERTSDVLAFGGYQQHFAGVVRVRKEGFPVPVKGDTFTLNGIVRRITSWDEDPISWKINSKDVSR